MKDIINFENLYKIDRDGNVYSIRKKRYLKPNLSGEYPRIKLSKDNKDYMFSIHKLVINTFMDNKDNKPIINHIDGDKLNYKLSNLEYSTYTENMIHAIETGLRKTIGKSRKLTKEDVVEIYKSDESGVQLSKKYNVSGSLISMIRNNKKWGDLNKELIYEKESLGNNDIRSFNQDNSKYIPNHSNYKIDYYGNILNVKTNYILKPSDRNGYLCINLNKKTYNIHRLVAEIFLLNLNNNYNMVNHKDGNKKNNYYENLEWCDASINSLHSKRVLNNKIYGENIGTSKLKEEEVNMIYLSKESNKCLSVKYGVSVSTISMIRNDKIWLNVTTKIDNNI